MNKYVPHAIIIPEDRADEEIANGFAEHAHVKAPRVSVAPPAGGWWEVVKVYTVEYIPYLRKYSGAHVIMLLDFDGQYFQRHSQVRASIPQDVSGRTFVVGTSTTPEALRQALGIGGFEAIGEALADDCAQNTMTYWGHVQLSHNSPELARLSLSVRPIVL
jgi:hypothetical protein